MPLHTDTNARMSIDGAICLRCLPVVKKYLPSLVTRYQKLSIVTEIYRTCISCAKMRCEFLRFYSTEVTILVLVNAYLIVWWLSCKILPSWMQCCCSNSSHFRIGYMLCHNRNTILPNKQFLIIRCAHKLILLDKINCVDSPQMLTVLKLFCSSCNIKLQNFLIIWSDQKRALNCWMEFCCKRYSFQLECS